MDFFKSLFRQKEYAPFFEDYLSRDFQKKNADLKGTRFVVFDTETTGFNYDLDRILSIGAVEIRNFEILIHTSFEIFIEQKHFDDKSVPIHGILRNDSMKQYTEKEAIEQFIKYIDDAILVGHNIEFDRNMVNEMLIRNGFRKLKNKFLDTRKLYGATRIQSPLVQQSNDSLDEIAEQYMLNVIDRHTAAGDALLTAMIFLKTSSFLQTNKEWSLQKMLSLQKRGFWRYFGL